MIVPEYWAEAKERVVNNGRAATYRRFGWSDQSQDDAYANAKERVEEAAERARRGEQVRLIDHKVSYNGAEGLPIREQIVERHGDTIITRNTYGALCLNTPRVLFADVDLQPASGGFLSAVLFVASIVLGLIAKELVGAWWPFWVLVISGVLLSQPLASLLIERITGGTEGAFARAMARIEKVAESHADWVLRVYRTPNGYRLLVMHTTFNPDDEDVYRFMNAVGSDKRYMQMCRNQKCFRARLTAKPWRIGFRRLTPRPGVWPVKEERLPERNQWIDEYQMLSREFAACRYVKSIGSGRTDRECEAVKEVHDEISKASRDLPIA